MKQITIYTKATCPYCDMAKRLLKEKSVTEFNEIRVDINLEELDTMIKKTGRRTVPQIFIGDIHVGGFDDLAKLNHDGKLDDLLGVS